MLPFMKFKVLLPDLSAPNKSSDPSPISVPRTFSPSYPSPFSLSRSSFSTNKVNSNLCTTMEKRGVGEGGNGETMSAHEGATPPSLVRKRTTATAIYSFTRSRSCALPYRTSSTCAKKSRAISPTTNKPCFFYVIDLFTGTISRLPFLPSILPRLVMEWEEEMSRVGSERKKKRRRRSHLCISYCVHGRTAKKRWLFALAPLRVTIARRDFLPPPKKKKKIRSPDMCSTRLFLFLSTY